MDRRVSDALGSRPRRPNLLLPLLPQSAKNKVRRVAQKSETHAGAPHTR